MEILGFVFELLFLLLGLYCYLFAIGKVTPKGDMAQIRATNFRKENSTWMRYFGLLLMAMASINILLHIYTLLK